MQCRGFESRSAFVSSFNARSACITENVFSCEFPVAGREVWPVTFNYRWSRIGDEPPGQMSKVENHRRDRLTRAHTAGRLHYIYLRLLKRLVNG